MLLIFGSLNITQIWKLNDFPMYIFEISSSVFEYMWDIFGKKYTGGFRGRVNRGAHPVGLGL